MPHHTEILNSFLIQVQGGFPASLEAEVMSFTRRQVFFVLSVLALTMPFSAGVTNLRDGDPCVEKWQGVVCDSSNITEIRIPGMKVGGGLSDTLADFSSIQLVTWNFNRKLTNYVVLGFRCDPIPLVRASFRNRFSFDAIYGVR
ncbi:hypothetical protein YC2023_112299 [Brassica napus]